MRIKLDYDIYVTCDELPEFDYEDSIEEWVDIDFQDIFEYVFERDTHKKYSYTSWYLEPKMKETYKQYEDRYLKNKIYLGDYEFIDFNDFMKDKHRSEVESKYEARQFNFLRTLFDINSLPLMNVICEAI